MVQMAVSKDDYHTTGMQLGSDTGSGLVVAEVSAAIPKHSRNPCNIGVCVSESEENSSYHDITIETAEFSERPVPYGLTLQLNKTAGWELWQLGIAGEQAEKLIGSEYGVNWLVVKFKGVVIVDSRK